MLKKEEKERLRLIIKIKIIFLTINQIIQNNMIIMNKMITRMNLKKMITKNLLNNNNNKNNNNNPKKIIINSLMRILKIKKK